MFLNNPSFGRLPQGERLERIKNSPNYKDGRFHNITPAPKVKNKQTKSKILNLFEFAFKKNSIEDLRPKHTIPTIKTDIKAIDINDNIAIWLGHSSLYLQINGTKFLVDPVLISASPLPYFNKAFEGSNIYTPSDIPEIDYVIITHDHWDHLDYNTILKIKNYTKNFICPLGVGEHLEYWGIHKKNIIELDWMQKAKLNESFTINCMPARHFSGRGLNNSNTTLWASYVLEGPSGNIFFSGDTGYDSHFSNIKNMFGKIELAFIENGQYDKQWQHIHLMPADFIKAVKDINPDTLITIHNSKYALARHKWYDPLDNAIKAAQENGFNLLTPMIGELINITKTNKQFKPWWESIK